MENSSPKERPSHVRKLVISFFAKLLMAATAHGILIDERTPDSCYQIAADEHHSVCQIKLIKNTKGSTSSGTGTLIGKRLVLTAAHVVEGMSSIGIVRFASNDGSQEQVRRVISFHMHPGYVRGSHSGSVDLAILVLESPITVAPPRPMNLMGMEKNFSWMSCVGYGKTGTISSGINEIHYQQLAKETRPIIREIQRYLRPGHICTVAEKNQALTSQLNALSKNAFKRFIVIPVEKTSSVNGLRYYIQKVEDMKPSTLQPHPLYGVPHQGDSGAALINEWGEVVGVLNHIINDSTVCWIDIAPYAEWIEAIVEKYVQRNPVF